MAKRYKTKYLLKNYTQCRTCKSIDRDSTHFCKLTGRDIAEYDPEDDCVNAVKVRKGWYQNSPSVKKNKLIKGEQK